MNNTNSEAVFDEHIKQIIPLLEDYADYDLVIAIPFYNETDTLPLVLKSIDQVLQSWIGRRQLIVCAGDCSAGPTLQAIQQMPMNHPRLEFLMPPEASGRGMSIRACIEIARILEADLLVFSANMATEQGPGIDLNWLDSLLTPIQGQYDMVIGSLRRHFGIDSIAYLLAAPILEVFYGSRMSDPLGGIYAFSHDLVEELGRESKFWTGIINGFGIDFWLITRALIWNKNICEVNMGGAVHHQDLKRRNQTFGEMALAIFESIKRDSAVWRRDRLLIKVADILARSEVEKADIINYPVKDLLHCFAKNYQESIGFIDDCMDPQLKMNLDKVARMSAEEFQFDDKLWVEGVLGLLLCYAFNEQRHKEIFTTLTALYNGRVAAYTMEMASFYEKTAGFSDPERDDLMVGKMDSIRHCLTGEFWRQKPHFSELWLSKSEQQKPPLVPLGYMEYVPGKPVVVPKKINGKDKRTVQADNVFKKLRKRYEEQFNSFVIEGLGLSHDAGPAEIISNVEKFMLKVESALNEIMPGDLFTSPGVREFADALFAIVPHRPMFTISSDLLREMLIRFPPVNLMIPLGCYRPVDLIGHMDPRDAITYANLTGNWSYSDRDLTWLTDQVKPENFEWVDIKALVLDKELPFGSMPYAKISNLNRITARISMKPLDEGMGGKYPRLRYFLAVIRRIAVAENYSCLFYQNVSERKNIGLKTRNSLLDMNKGDEFSARNMFENFHHRSMVDKIRKVSENLNQTGRTDLAGLFALVADGYGLCQVLENGTFLTCTAWSWASYSFKGGLNIPTPMTTSVEARWFNHDFLEALYQELGYNQREILQTTLSLIQAGQSGHNLLDNLLPARPRDVAVIVQETTNDPSRFLLRYSGNPILETIEDHDWECKYVLNPGALRIKEHVYLFYRAVGRDNVSHIGLAVTDGYKVLERLPQPIFSPQVPEERMGCEDPRLIIIDQRIWMLYTAYDGNIAQIAAASITVDDFLHRRYDKWKREGLAFKNIWDKDAVLFPEKIKGKYILYHRIEPSMWITYMNDLAFPCREKHAIIIGPRPGRMWDSLKIGAGAQPLKTRYGWLLIYHGVDYNYVYRLGTILVDLANPQKVIYRSPNPILEPVEDYEIGLSGAWVPNVVFTCGAVAGTDKEVLDDDDEILVYYGAADTSIGLAKATLAELIPEKYRKQQ